MFPDIDGGQSLYNSLYKVCPFHIIKLKFNDLLFDKIDVLFLGNGARWFKDSSSDELKWNITEKISSFSKQGKIIVGTGEGVELLCLLGLLPGRFVSKKRNLFSKQVFIKIANSQSILTHRIDKSYILKIPMLSFNGSYVASERELIEMRQNRQILFHYCNELGQISESCNWSGSVDNIAGISNSDGNVCGIVPRPELAIDELNGSSDGRYILQSVFSWFVR